MSRHSRIRVLCFEYELSSELNVRIIVAALASTVVLLGACVDMGSVSDFAKQSGQVAANKPALDASAAQGRIAPRAKIRPAPALNSSKP